MGLATYVSRIRGTKSNIAPRFRKRALGAALKALKSGSSADEAIAAAKQADKSRTNYMATSTLVLGAMSAGVGLFVGGIRILATLFAIASALQGRRSTHRACQAWTDLGLAALGVALFGVRLVLPS